MKPSQTESFNELLRVLKSLPEDLKSFSMENWVHDCGTPACAIGHAFSDPWFKSHGAQLALDVGTFPPQVLIPIFSGKHSFSAIAEFFSISQKDALSLFTEEAYEDLLEILDVDEGRQVYEKVRPSHVIAAVEAFMKSQGIPVLPEISGSPERTPPTIASQ